MVVDEAVNREMGREVGGGVGGEDGVAALRVGLRILFVGRFGGVLEVGLGVRMVCLG